MISDAVLYTWHPVARRSHIERYGFLLGDDPYIEMWLYWRTAWYSPKNSLVEGERWNLWYVKWPRLHLPDINTSFAHDTIKIHCDIPSGMMVADPVPAVVRNQEYKWTLL